MFFAISIDFHAAHLDLRGRALPSDPEILNQILGALAEKVWLSTCNRLEIYGIQPDEDALEIEKIVDRWIALCQLDASARTAFRVFRSKEAYEHLFRVTSSLESMVVGETQIHGQVKKAYETAVSQNNVGAELHRIFQRAFKVAKKIRSQTEVGRLAVSIPSIGVKLAEKILGDLTKQNVAILGLGEIGVNAAEHFASVQPNEIHLFNRTESVARDLVSRLRNQGTSAHLLQSPEAIPKSVNAIVLAANGVLISKETLREKDEQGQSFFVLDLAVPSYVPSLSLTNGFIFRIDDLQKIAEENSELRKQELSRAEKIIRADLDVFESSMTLKSLDETLRDVSQKTTLITEKELNDLRQKLPHLSDSDWDEIERMARRLGSKVLQDPMVELKSLSKQGGEPETLVQFFRSLFRI